MKKLTFVLLILSLMFILSACSALTPAFPPTASYIGKSPTPKISPPEPTTTRQTSALVPQSDVTVKIFHLQMIDARNGWAVVGVNDEGSAGDGIPDASYYSDASFYLMRTTDGGETWQDVTPPTDFTPSVGYGQGVSLFAIDAKNAWAVSSGGRYNAIVWRTQDGGNSWKPGETIYLDEQDTFTPWLQFVDEKHGWLTLHFQSRIQSKDLEYRSSDGGITWGDSEYCFAADGMPGGCDVPVFINEHTGWREPRSLGFLAEPSLPWQVERTLDGGRTWSAVSLPTPDDLAEQVAMLIGDDHVRSDNHLFCHLNFARVDQDGLAIRMDCSINSYSKGRPLATKSYYYFSGDQGNTWHTISLPGKTFSLVSPVSGYETQYRDVHTTGNLFFLDMTTGWWLSAVEDEYSLAKTTDGGLTWQKMADGLAWKDGFQFVDANTGWVVTDSKHLERTTDGGQTWTELKPLVTP